MPIHAYTLNTKSINIDFMIFYSVFVGGGGFGHQRFGRYPFSQVVPAYFVDVALSPKTASDISNLKSTILV